MKKILAIIIAITLAFAFVGCKEEKTLEDVIDRHEILADIDLSQFGGMYSDIDVKIEKNTLKYIYTYSYEYDAYVSKEFFEAADTSSLEAVSERIFKGAKDEGIKGKVTVIYSYCYSTGEEIINFEYTSK